jgi:hypothetical protein
MVLAGNLSLLPDLQARPLGAVLAYAHSVVGTYTRLLHGPTWTMAFRHSGLAVALGPFVPLPSSSAAAAGPSSPPPSSSAATPDPSPPPPSNSAAAPDPSAPPPSRLTVKGLREDESIHAGNKGVSRPARCAGRTCSSAKGLRGIAEQGNGQEQVQMLCQPAGAVKQVGEAEQKHCPPAGEAVMQVGKGEGEQKHCPPAGGAAMQVGEGEQVRRPPAGLATLGLGEAGSLLPGGDMGGGSGAQQQWSPEGAGHMAGALQASAAGSSADSASEHARAMQQLPSTAAGTTFSGDAQLEEDLRLMLATTSACGATALLAEFERSLRWVALLLGYVG